MVLRERERYKEVEGHKRKMGGRKMKDGKKEREMVGCKRKQ